MIGIMRGTTRIREEVQGLPAPVASFTPKSAKCLDLQVAVTATQSGSGDPSPDNVRPISGWSSVSVVRCGKNLFDKSTISDNTRLNTTNGQEEAGNGYCVSDYICVKANVSYYFPNTSSARCWFYNELKQPITYNFIPNNRVFTPTENGYVRITIYKLSVDFNTYQAELGSTATAYEPYNGNTYIVNLGGTYYGGVLDVTSGVFTATHTKFTFDENSSWTMLNSYIQSALVDGMAITTGYMGLCNFIPVRNSIGPGIMIGSNSRRVYIGRTFLDDLEITTVDDWKDYLRNQNLEITAPLATPFTIQLTPQQVQLLANQVNTIFANSGDINSLVYGGLVNTVLVGRG